MSPYSQLAQALKDKIEVGELKPGKSISLKQLALAAGQKPGVCVEALRPWMGAMFLDDELKALGVDDVIVQEIGSGQYRRKVFKRIVDSKRVK